MRLRIRSPSEYLAPDVLCSDEIQIQIHEKGIHIHAYQRKP